MKTLIVRNIIVSIFAVMLSMCSVQGISYAQEVPDTIVEFVDVNLAKEVRRVLELGTEAGVEIRKIPKAELIKLTTLEAEDREIVDLTGLEHATQLNWLNLYNNNVSDITPLTQLTQLTTLYLQENQISDITPLAQLTQLTYLNLRDNQIRDVSPLANLMHLETLFLANNPITDKSPLRGLLGKSPGLDIDISVYDYIQGPWLWMIAPGSDIDTDYLAVQSENTITEAQVAQNGVNVGDTLDELQWTSESIYPSTHCGWFLCASNNVQHVVNAAGLSTVQNLSDHTAYAFINIVSPRDQNNVRMGVGSDDAVKIWLNGTVVFRKETSRRTTGIQNRFDTNLKAGNNRLFVKVSEYSGNWGMFFKIYTEFETSIYMMDGLPSIAADINEDGQVDILDLILVINALDETGNTRVDVNSDGKVDKLDLLIIVENLDESAIPDAPMSRMMLATLEPATLQAWINLLHIEGDGSLASRQALAILQRFLVVRLPDQTVLLPNFPNPFNPETWIPYHLAEPTEVTITIYAINGQVVRRLALGHQSAGVYQTRSRAAYWDGKNASGEPVASGVYFYTITAGNFTATRKMLIRK